MRKTNPIEDELDKIRSELYEETKNLTPEEFLNYYRLHGERIAKEFGFTIVRSLEDEK
jgi:hypothetical protein